MEIVGLTMDQELLEHLFGIASQEGPLLHVSLFDWSYLPNPIDVIRVLRGMIHQSAKIRESLASATRNASI